MRRIPAFLSDRRGTSFVQALILLLLLALAGIAAARALGGKVNRKTDCTGDAIVGMTSGALPCAEGGPGSGGSDAIPGTGGDEGGPGGPGTPGDGPGQGGDGAEGGNGPGGSGGNGGDGAESGNGPGGNGAEGGNGGNGAEGGNGGNGAEGGDSGQPGAPKKDDPSNKVGGGGSVTTRNNGKTTSGEKTAGGARPRTAEEEAEANKKKPSKADIEIGGEKKFLDEKGALGEKKFAGGSETLSGGFGKAEGVGFAKASVKDGASAGGKIEGKASAVNLQGKHELPGGIEESHEVNVLSVKGSLEGKAGISKDVIGATISGEAGANIAEAQVSGKKVFKIPFTNFGFEVGGTGSASAGANIGGEASAGSFKGEDGKRRIGVKAGFKAALGLGLGGKLSLNVVF